MAEGMLGRLLLFTPDEDEDPPRSSSTLYGEGRWRPLAKLRGYIWGPPEYTGVICEISEVLGEVGAEPMRAASSCLIEAMPRSEGLMVDTAAPDMTEEPEDSAEPTGES